MAVLFSWRSFCEFYAEFWLVLRQQTHATHCSVYYNKQQLAILCIFPTLEARKSAWGRLCNLLALVYIDAFFLTLVLAAPDWIGNVVDMGQQFLWIAATIYMAFKWHYFYFNAFKIDEVIAALDSCHRVEQGEEFEKAVHFEQRAFFLMESGLGLLWHVAIVAFVSITLMQPVWTDQSLPFLAWYPFDWGNPDKHPVGYVLMYIWQSVFLGYNCWCILFTELFSVHCFSQIAVNLKILSIKLDTFGQIYQNDARKFRDELRRLVAFHQRIIGIVNSYNEVFYGPMIMQMIVSYLLISLSIFETLVARNDPKIAVRFLIFMAMSFFHFSYWCYFGDMVTSHATDVAFSAYNAYQWSPQSPSIQKDLMFIIKRAQKPLRMAASPFPPFNMFSYMDELRQVYTILTVLLESMD